MVGMRRIGGISTPGKRVKQTKKAQGKKKQTKKMAMPIVVSCGKQAFPNILRNTVRYVETVGLTLTAGIFNFYVWTCNGLYDPNITGTGHQPMYFDQITSLYSNYAVLGSRFKCSVTSVNVNALLGACCIVDDDATSPGGVQAMSERHWAKVNWYNPQTSSAPEPVLYQKWNAAQYFGAIAPNRSDLQGNISNNPTQQSYYIVGLQDQNSVTNTYYLNVEIEYDVEWSELITVGQS